LLRSRTRSWYGRKKRGRERKKERKREPENGTKNSKKKPPPKNQSQALYKYVVPKPKSECSKQEQLAVSFAAGYIAGVFCAVVSHPADNLVSKLNANKGVTAGEIVKEMGWVALMTRGLPLRIIMIGTLTGLQWGIYDAFKVAVGLPTTGSAAPPAK
jgi:solute carrier family 25 phosphate transporter 3